MPGGVETRYSCCEGVMGAPGCQLFKVGKWGDLQLYSLMTFNVSVALIWFSSLYQLHVHDSISLDGFVATVPRRPSDTSCPGVYSVDCEMVT